MSLLSLAARLPIYWLSRRLGWKPPLPFSLVLSVCYRCNSRCSTCNVWKRQALELRLDEWENIFRHLGRAPYYLTFSGGEPFLREDLAEIVDVAYRHCRPSVITIPTNGLLTKRVVTSVETIVRSAPTAQIGINLSLDAAGEEHDRIRNVPGNWEKAMETYAGLKALTYPNLTLSIHTVISRFNVERIPQIYEQLMELEPDSYITEIAEERGELDTIGTCITPAPADYARVADFLIDRLSTRSFRGLAHITQAFRAQYYILVKRVLVEQRQVIPCYAGWASGHIAPDGDVWTCCVRAQPIGNLRDADYDLRRIWHSPGADTLRRSIRAGECACPMANAGYSNMLLHPATLARVAGSLMARQLPSAHSHRGE